MINAFRPAYDSAVLSSALCLGGPADWGDVPTWLGGIAAVAATIGAFLAARYTWHTLQLERQRDHDAAAQQRRSQALGVAAWAQGQAWLADDPLRMVVRNDSALPIYEVTYTAYLVTQAPEQGITLSLPSLAPATQYVVTIDRQWNEPVECVVTFTDAAGVRWIRAPRGQITELPLENA